MTSPAKGVLPRCVFMFAMYGDMKSGTREALILAYAEPRVLFGAGTSVTVTSRISTTAIHPGSASRYFPDSSGSPSAALPASLMG